MDYSRTAPKNKNSQKICATCENCKSSFYEKESSYKKKKRHFCSMKCYADFRKTLPFDEQANYKGIRKKGETKYAYHKLYVKRNPELIAHLKARRYAREKGAEGSHTLAEWQELKNKFNNKCCHCQCEKPLTKDHIIPLSKGGSDYISNIAPLCASCNSKKYNHLPSSSGVS